MTACKYWDCGWCYAPNYLKTNAINSTCVNPYKCPISPLSEPVQYETPMTEIEEVKAQIKVLEKKLSFLEELEKTKSPLEEAYKDWWGQYPKLETDSKYDYIRWHGFQAGYNAAYEEPEDTVWKSVALKLGENLSDSGPDGYYEFSPDEWFEWVIDECLTNEVKRLQRKEWNAVHESVKWCEENPDKDPLDWLKPQTPEQVADGLKEAFREAIKGGIIPEVNKPTDELIEKLVNNPPEFLKFELGPNLYDLIEDWWSDIFTVQSDMDMETSIYNLTERIEKWLPREQSAAGSQSLGVEDMVEGFNDAIKKIKKKLR